MMTTKTIKKHARFFAGFVLGAALLSVVYLTSHVLEKSDWIKPKVMSCEITNVPRAAYIAVLYFQRFKHGPPSYIQVRKFETIEGLLPTHDQTGNVIQYYESDLFPALQGINRGIQRIVVGSDGSAYYTDDHYRTFVRITPNCVHWFVRNAKNL